MDTRAKNQIRDFSMADYFDLIFDSFLELHGDRRSGDDEFVIGGLARLDGHKVIAIGYQWNGTAGISEVPVSKGYRKSLRLMRLAESFAKPVILFIDVPEFASLLELEQQTSESISRNLQEISRSMTPIIGVIMGKSTGLTAVDLCAADRAIMLENATCCNSYNRFTLDGENVKLCLKAQELQDSNVVNKLVKETAEDDPKSAAYIMREAIQEELDQLAQADLETLVQERLHRLQYLFLNFEISKPPSDR